MLTAKIRPHGQPKVGSLRWSGNTVKKGLLKTVTNRINAWEKRDRRRERTILMEEASRSSRKCITKELLIQMRR